MLHNRHVSMLMQQFDADTLRIEITDILSVILVFLGIIGNLLGLFIFSSSRRARKISPVYTCLATSSSIINFCCVIRYGLTLNSKSLHFISEIVGRKLYACKIYELSFACRVTASWITLFWMCERVTCLSTRLRTLFYRWNDSQWKFLWPFFIISAILFIVLGPPVYMFELQISKKENSTANSVTHFCGISPEEPAQWQRYFNDLYLGLNHYTIRCVFSELIPTAVIILFDSSIVYHLVHKFRHLNEPKLEEIARRQKTTASWMTIILFIHSLLFFVSLISHIGGHFMSVEAHETWWVMLAVLLNSSLNFYIYCLSSRAFRDETIRLIRHLTIERFYQLQTRKRVWKQRQLGNGKPLPLGLIYRQKSSESSSRKILSSQRNKRQLTLK